jgi:hypothetical protein
LTRQKRAFHQRSAWQNDLYAASIARFKKRVNKKRGGRRKPPRKGGQKNQARLFSPANLSIRVFKAHYATGRIP